MAGGGKAEDTYLVGGAGLERVTDSDDWPLLARRPTGRARRARRERRMKATRALGRLGLPLPEPAPTSGARFPDGAHFRVEIPSVEGPRVLAEVIESAAAEGITVNRVSQGSGAMLLSLAELREMSALGAEAGIEVSLFVGPREGFDVGAHARSADGAAHFGQLRGARGLAYAVEDVARACEQGIRSFLVADLGLLSVLTEMQRNGELPESTRVEDLRDDGALQPGRAAPARAARRHDRERRRPT